MFFFCSTCNSLPPVSFRVRSSLSSASRASLISSTTYLLRKYCFLFPAKRNSGSAPRGCWPLCDFAPVNSPWSRLSSAAFSSCCFRSFLAQSGGSDGECDRQREWWCAEAWEDSLRSSPASLDRPVVRLESFHSTGSRTRALPRHRNILQKRQRPQQRYRKKRSAKRRSSNGGRQQKKLNSETPRDLKTPRTLEPILPAVCGKKPFPLLSFLSQRKTTLFVKFFGLIVFSQAVVH